MTGHVTQQQWAGLAPFGQVVKSAAGLLEGDSETRIPLHCMDIVWLPSIRYSFVRLDVRLRGVPVMHVVL